MDASVHAVRVFGVRGNASAHAGVDAELEVSSRGLRLDRLVRDGDDGRASTTRRALLGKFPYASVVSASRVQSAVGDDGEVELVVSVSGGRRSVRLACGGATAAAQLLGRVFECGGDELRERSISVRPTTPGSVSRPVRSVGTPDESSRAALVRDLREENLLLSKALERAEEALHAASNRDALNDDADFDGQRAAYEIKLRNLAKNLEFQEGRAARLAADVEEQRGKIERYRSVEEVLGKENDALRKDLTKLTEERDKAVRRAEASEVMTAHARNEVEALQSGEMTQPALFDENASLKRELAVVTSAKSTAEEHLKLTLAHLRSARDENVKLTEQLLKKTDESFEKDAQLAELEQMIESSVLRENTGSKELSLVIEERTDAMNRVKILEKDVKRLSGEVERLVAKLGDAEREALREKEEIRYECAEQVQEYAAQVAKHTASARDAAIEAQRQASIAHNAHIAKQEMEFELHEERRKRIALERQIESMEAAKQTIAEFTADAEASVLRSIQAQREANAEVQRLRVEKHDLQNVLSATKSASPGSPAQETQAWRTQLSATLDLHRTLRGSPTTTPSAQNYTTWSRLSDFGSGASFKKPVPSSAQRLEEIKSEIAIIKQRQTPVRASLETKFNLSDGPRVTATPTDVYATPGK